MNKFILILSLLFSIVTVNAQTAIEKSRLTDNVDIAIQSGIVTPFNHFLHNESITPIVGLSVNKYINPWLGVGIEGKTSIGVGDEFNTHTTFDAVNVSGLIKFNILNFFNYTGRKFFEPVIVTGLGWGHTTCSAFFSEYYNAGMIGISPSIHETTSARNYMTYRAGMELNFNVNNALSIRVTPAVVWNDNCNGRLTKQNGNFEITTGIAYHFTNSNGTRNFKAWNISALTDTINNLRKKNILLENRKPEVITNTIIKETFVNRITIIPFAFDSFELSPEALNLMDNLTATKVLVFGYASPEGTEAHNNSLSSHRASAVADYLVKRGIEVIECEGRGAVDNQSNRLVKIIAQ